MNLDEFLDGPPVSAPKIGTGEGWATTFGYNDPMDNGVGAWGDVTNDPNIMGVSLPRSVLADYFEDEDLAHNALVEVTNPATGKTVVVPIVDKGPAPWTGNALDLTHATNAALGGTGKTPMQYRILGHQAAAPKVDLDAFLDGPGAQPVAGIPTAGVSERADLDAFLDAPTAPSPQQAQLQALGISKEQLPMEAQSRLVKPPVTVSAWDQVAPEDRARLEQLGVTPEEWAASQRATLPAPVVSPAEANKPQVEKVDPERAKIGPWSSAWASFAQSAGRTPSDVMGALNLIDQIAAEKNGTMQQREVAEMWRQALRAYEKDLPQTYKTNPKYEQGFVTGVLPSGAGSLPGYILSGTVGGRGLSSITGALQSAQGLYLDAKAKGASEEVARQAFLAGLPIGALEGVLGIGKGGLQAGAKGLRGVAKEVGQEIAEESLQEGGSQLASNIAARAIYDPRQTVLGGVGEAALAGGILGGAARAPGAIAGAVAEKATTTKKEISPAQIKDVLQDSQEKTPSIVDAILREDDYGVETAGALSDSETSVEEEAPVQFAARSEKEQRFREDMQSQREFFDQKAQEAGLPSARDANPDQVLEWAREWREEHPRVQFASRDRVEEAKQEAIAALPSVARQQFDTGQKPKLKAAVRTASGQIVTGANHGIAFDAATEQGLVGQHAPIDYEQDVGFVTENGEYLTRLQASIVTTGRMEGLHSSQVPKENRVQFATSSLPSEQNGDIRSPMPQDDAAASSQEQPSPESRSREARWMEEAELIPRESFYPKNGIQRQEQVDSVAADFKNGNGWNGRPLLGVRFGDEVRGVTGSHRWAAAKQAGLNKIPVVVIEAEDLNEALEDIQESGKNTWSKDAADFINQRDDELFDDLYKLKDRFPVAFELMSREVDVNPNSSAPKEGAQFTQRPATTSKRSTEINPRVQRLMRDLRLLAPGASQEVRIGVSERSAMAQEGLMDPARPDAAMLEAAYIPASRSVRGSEEIRLFAEAISADDAYNLRNAMHELGHAFYNRLSPSDQARLLKRWRAEFRAKTGVYAEGATDLQNMQPSSETDMGAFYEWFAETMAVENAEWARRKLAALQEHDGSLLGRVAAAFRQFLFNLWKTLNRGDATIEGFRRFLEKGSPQPRVDKTSGQNNRTALQYAQREDEASDNQNRPTGRREALTEQPFKSAADDIRRGAEAIRRDNPARSKFSAEFEALYQRALDNDLIIPRPAEISRAADAEGQEHEVWFDPQTNQVWKLSKPNQFGQGFEGDATAADYFERWALQNHFFGDDIQFHGIVIERGKLRVLISQPALKGGPLSDPEITQYFQDRGFHPIQISDRTAWYNPDHNLLAGDAHAGNFVRTAKGIEPIDLVLTQPTGNLLKEVQELLGNTPSQPDWSNITEDDIQFAKRGGPPAPPAQNTQPYERFSIQRLATRAITGRLFTDGATDILNRTGHPVAQRLARAFQRQFDAEADIFGRLATPFDRLLEAAPQQRQQAYQEWEQYFRARENGRAAEAALIRANMSPLGDEMVRQWEYTARETGQLNQRLNVQVQQPDGTWRRIGNMGERFFPRQIRQEVRWAINHPLEQRAQPILTELRDALRAQGRTEEEINQILDRNDSAIAGARDFFGSLERSRTGQLPEQFYEYRYDRVVPQFLGSYSKRLSQIMAYGQGTLNLDSGRVDGPPGSHNLFAETLQYSGNRRTDDYIKESYRQAYQFQSDRPFVAFARRAQMFSSLLQLANIATAARNLISGQIANVEAFGLRRSFLALARMGDQMTARDIGTVRANLWNAMQYGDIFEPGRNAFDDALATVTNVAMTATGYNIAEDWNRRLATFAALQFITDGVREHQRNPNSGRSNEFFAFLTRAGVNPDEIINDGGNPNAASVRSAVRALVRESQFGYRFDQVPLWAGSPVGRFIYQYGRWGQQRTRDFFRNAVMPALVGTEIVRNGQLQRVRTPGRLFRSMIAIPFTGSAFAWLAWALFGRDEAEESWEEIAAKAEKDSPSAAVLAAFDKMYSQSLMGGMLGIFGQPQQMVQEFRTVNRVKNPLQPPSFGWMDATTKLALAMWDQREYIAKTGTIPDEDLTDFRRGLAPGVGNLEKFVLANAARLGDQIEAVKENKSVRRYDAQLKRNILRVAARRFADAEGIDYENTFGGITRKNERSPIYNDIKDALYIGDAAEAKRIADEYLETFPPEGRKKALTAIKASVSNGQPFRIGNLRNQDLRKEFMDWAEENLSDYRFQAIRDVDSAYYEAAVKAGLMKRRGAGSLGEN